MQPIEKEEKNSPSANLQFSDNASDDQISIDKENVWDSDINIIDDDFNVINNGDNQPQENKPTVSNAGLPRSTILPVYDNVQLAFDHLCRFGHAYVFAWLMLLISRADVSCDNTPNEIGKGMSCQEYFVYTPGEVQNNGTREKNVNAEEMSIYEEEIKEKTKDNRQRKEIISLNEKLVGAIGEGSNINSNASFCVELEKEGNDNSVSNAQMENNIRNNDNKKEDNPFYPVYNEHMGENLSFSVEVRGEHNYTDEAYITDEKENTDLSDVRKSILHSSSEENIYDYKLKGKSENTPQLTSDQRDGNYFEQKVQALSNELSSVKDNYSNPVKHLLHVKNLLSSVQDEKLIDYFEGVINRMDLNDCSNYMGAKANMQTNPEGEHAQPCKEGSENKIKPSEDKTYYLDIIERMKSEIKKKGEKSKVGKTGEGGEGGEGGGGGEAKVTHLQNECNNLKRIIEEYETKKREYITLYEQTKSENEQIHTKLREFERNCNMVRNEKVKSEETYEHLKTQCNEITNKYETLKIKCSEYEKRYELLQRKFKQEEKTCDDYEKKYQELKRIIENKDMLLHQKDYELKENIAQHETELSNQNWTIQKLEKQVDEYAKKLRNEMEYEKKNDEMHKYKIDSLEQKITHLEHELNDKKRENALLINSNKELHEVYANLKTKEEENEQNINNLKSNLQINEKEHSLTHEKLQEQNSKIENLLILNNKNGKMIELLKNEKLKMENENNILKKNLLTVQEELKKIEKHSYDIYEIKNYLENTLDKNKSLVEELESEKNQKEELKNKIKLFLTEMNNSAIALETYKLKCSFFINIVRNYEEKVNMLGDKLKNYEWEIRRIRKGRKERPVALSQVPVHGESPPERGGDTAHSVVVSEDDSGSGGPAPTQGELGRLIEETVRLRDQLDLEVSRREDALKKLKNMLSVVKEKNLIINEKNYKLNKYRMLNKNLKSTIQSYQDNNKSLKENIHNLEKQIELKEVKNLVLPPKLTVHISKLSSFENNLKNELKELIGNSSNFLENTFKYINENPLKKNLQNKTFFSSIAEKKNEDLQKTDTTKDALLNTYTHDLVDVKGFAKNFIYNNMNIIPNFMNDQNFKSDEVCKNEEKWRTNSEQSGEEVTNESRALNDRTSSMNKNNIVKDNTPRLDHNSSNMNSVSGASLSEHLETGEKIESSNRYIDLFIGKKNMNKSGSKNCDLLNVQHVSQFYTNTENKIKDLFDMNKKKDVNKMKEKEDASKNVTVNDSNNPFSSSRYNDNNPLHEITYEQVNTFQADPECGNNVKGADIGGRWHTSPTSEHNFDRINSYSDGTCNTAMGQPEEETSKYDLHSGLQKVWNKLHTDDPLVVINLKKERSKVENKNEEKLQPNISDEEAQINDDVWNEKIDLDSFEIDDNP
ncbi:rhoptry protein, putative [Plasmodium ovale wallikeri]|uniref:Rhoptry protein, putative n=1 Tax=Plasmodium ovale wallikeri TaxID=864142 RepID=A0A1A8ZET0_PLAOA|nr:rhoptry protein, putative [Plasmodium ovale wallikeri]